MATANEERVKSLVRAAKTPLDRFLVAGMIAILGAMDLLDGVLNSLRERPLDLDQPVAGKPFQHWVGKTPDQIRKELGDDKLADEVLEAFEVRSMSIDDGAGEDRPAKGRATKANRAASPDANAGTGSTSQAGDGGSEGATPNDDGGDGEGDGAEEDADKAPKIAGYKLSDLAGKSDEELLAMDNIGPKTVLKIREMEAELANTAPPPTT